MFRSTRGASKQRRDLINNEIGHLRDLLPLPESARQRLSQLQIMSLCCCYIRKCNYFSRMFGNGGSFVSETPFQFSQAMNGFLLITTREGKLLYISENITEYLGHSMVDMMTQGDSLYDIIDKRDHANVQAQLLQSDYTNPSSPPGIQASPVSQEERTFFCRMNVARSFRRQAGFGDHKMMHVRGHFIHPTLRDHYGNQPVFMAICSPLVTPDVKEAAVQSNTMIYQSVHGLDLKFIEVGHVGEHHLGYSEAEMYGKSLYEILHPEDVHEAKEKHIQLIKSSHEMGCMLTVRLQNSSGYWFWVNMVMHVRQPFVCDNGEPAIICINHVIDESEAQHFKMQSQLFSSHIAPSPEYLGQGASPPHTITQVAVETEPYQLSASSFMGALQSQSLDEPGMYFGEIGVTVTTTEDVGSGGMPPSTEGRVEGIPLGHSHSQGSTLGHCTDAELSQSPMPQEALHSQVPHQSNKQIQRADILSKLKRKMTEHALQQCKPAKRACMGTSPEHHNGSGGYGSAIPHLAYSASVITAPVINEFGSNSLELGDVQVLGPVGHNTVFADLKKDIKVEASPQQLTCANPRETIMQPMTPLTPTSMTSESSNDLMTSLSIDVDMNDTAIVPASVLTPESSPAPSPDQAMSPTVSQELPTTIGQVDLEDLSFFDNADTKEESTKKVEARAVIPPEPIRGLPVLDTFNIEDFLTEMERQKPTQVPAQPSLMDASRLQKTAHRNQLHPVDQLPNLSDEMLARLVSEALKDMKTERDASAVEDELCRSFMLVPEQLSQPQQHMGLVPSAGPFEDSSSDGDFIHGLPQLNDTFVNSPSYGEDELASALFQ